jgi:tagatose 1,6-diphosphate aldolase
MTQMLTPGRWRGLKTTSTGGHVFTILAFDQRGTYHKMLPAGTPLDTAMQIKRDIVVALSSQVSAVLLDAEMGMQAAFDMPGSIGLLMALEKSGYSGDSTYRKIDFTDGWTVAKIKEVGASAVKLLAYYHPESGVLAEEIESMISTVRVECHRHDIPLFVEPMSYSLDKSVAKESAEFAKTRPAVVKETARRLGKLGMDVLKMEFPVDTTFDTDQRAWQAACEGISEVIDVPWVLLSAGVNFDVFEPQVQVACRSGASGFLAGRAIWKEGIPMPAAERMDFIKKVAADRLQRLVDTTVKNARPWTDFYRPITPTENWFREAARQVAS